MDSYRPKEQLQNAAGQSPFVQPILNIAKASTPLRTRPIQIGHPNATSMMMNKQTSSKGVDISNKENFSNNKEKFGCQLGKMVFESNDSLASRAMSPVQTRPFRQRLSPSFSPTLSPNRSLLGGQLQQSRVQLSESQPVVQESSSLLMSRQSNDHPPIPPNQHYQMGGNRNSSFQEEFNSKQYQTNTSLVSSGSLKSSSSFKSLLETKYRNAATEGVKSPNKTCFIAQDRPNSPQMATQRFSSLLGKNSKSSQDQDAPIQCQCGASKRELQFVIRDYNQQPQQFFCANCAVFARKQGQNVEKLNEIELKQLDRIKNGAHSRPHQHKSDLVQKLRQNLTSRLQGLNEARADMANSELKVCSQIDQYYNELIDVIENLRFEDQARAAEVFKQRQISRAHLEKELQKMMRRAQQSTVRQQEVTEMLENLQKTPINEHLPIVIERRDPTLARFKQTAAMHRIQLVSPTGHPGPPNNALRFSFEQALLQKDFKKNRSGATMKTLQEEEEFRESEQDVEKDPYRILFPEEGEDDKSFVSSPVFKQF